MEYLAGCLAMERYSTKVGLSCTVPMEELSPEIGNLTSLEELCLVHNRLTVLPPEIGNLSNLSNLDLSYNRLASLPPECRRSAIMGHF